MRDEKKLFNGPVVCSAIHKDEVNYKKRGKYIEYDPA